MTLSLHGNLRDNLKLFKVNISSEGFFFLVLLLSGIGAGVGALVLAAVVILVVYAVYRSRRKPPVPTEESDDAPLKESTYTVRNTPRGQQPETKGDSKGDFVQMTVAKQESASA